MEAEETKLINDDKKRTVENESVISEKKKSSGASNAVFAAGGFVAGAAATVGVQATAANNAETPNAVHPEEQAETAPASASTPASDVRPQNVTPIGHSENPGHNIPDQSDVILATDEGVRVAQVDDSQSFSSAFADARAQVGPGGVFEWHGKVYGTYYKEEWDAMSSAERHEYQSKIDYQDVTSHSNTAEVHPETADAVPTSQVQEGGSQSEIGSQPETEVRVLGIEEMPDGEGQMMTVVAVEMDGQNVLLVDVDHDGQIDLVMADVNGDGQLSDDEIADISASEIQVADLQQHLEGNDASLLASDDSMPDYMNDANAGNFLA